MPLPVCSIVFVAALGFFTVEAEKQLNMFTTIEPAVEELQRTSITNTLETTSKNNSVLTDLHATNENISEIIFNTIRGTFQDNSTFFNLKHGHNISTLDSPEHGGNISTLVSPEHGQNMSTFVLSLPDGNVTVGTPDETQTTDSTTEWTHSSSTVLPQEKQSEELLISKLEFYENLLSLEKDSNESLRATKQQSNRPISDYVPVTSELLSSSPSSNDVPFTSTPQSSSPSSTNVPITTAEVNAYPTSWSISDMLEEGTDSSMSIRLDSTTEYSIDMRMEERRNISLLTAAEVEFIENSTLPVFYNSTFISTTEVENTTAVGWTVQTEGIRETDLLTLCAKYTQASGTRGDTLQEAELCSEAGSSLSQLIQFILYDFDGHTCGNSDSTAAYSQLLFCAMANAEAQCQQPSKLQVKNLDKVPPISTARLIIEDLCAVNQSLARKCMSKQRKYISECIKSEVDLILDLRGQKWTYGLLDSCRHLEVQVMCVWEQLEECGEWTAGLMVGLVSEHLRFGTCTLSGAEIKCYSEMYYIVSCVIFLLCVIW